MKAGTRLKSQIGTTEVIVVRPPANDVALCCAGRPLVAADAAHAAEPADGSGEPVQLGKRYVDEQSGLELLCVSAGPGPLVCDERELAVKSAKALPSSD